MDVVLRSNEYPDKSDANGNVMNPCPWGHYGNDGGTMLGDDASDHNDTASVDRNSMWRIAFQASNSPGEPNATWLSEACCELHHGVTNEN